MEILPEPKGVDAKVLELLKALMGEDGITFLDLNKAITAVKDGQPVWQAPFAIGLRILPSLYRQRRLPLMARSLVRKSAIYNALNICT
jgi:hypothetical protein